MNAEPKPDVLLVEPGLVVATWNDVFIEDWRGPVGASAVREKYNRQLAFQKRLGKPTALLSVVRDGAMGAPDGDTRAVMNAMNPQTDPATKAAVIAILSSGFGGSLIRGVIAGLMLARRGGFPVKVLDSVDAATAWLAPYLERSAAGAVLPRDVEDAYRALDSVIPKDRR